MITTIVIYILLLTVFLVISGLIFRHTVKYSYLSPRFTYVVFLFAFVSVIIIIFSIYLLFKAGGASSSGSYFNNETPTKPSTSGSELNF